MRKNYLAGLFLIVMLIACTSQPVAMPTSTPSPAPSAIVSAHAAEIRFALIGQPKDVNVWQLFDASGASYADYALRSEYWPRLYHLAPPGLTFQALAADGMPSEVTQDGETYSATVKLRANLKWTDASPFTADDIAFTVNTALAFELGLDWNAYYPRDYLARVEAVDPSTVRFVFKQKPNVEVWQYGALQGPIIQKAYWEPLIKSASGLLPDEALRAQVEQARVYLAQVQSTVKDLTAQVNALRLNGQTDRKLEGNLTGSQNELTFAQNTLNKLLEEYDLKIKSGREALYAVRNQGEPTLGTWTPKGKQKDVWVNEANPDFPFAHPNFDRAVYAVYANEADAEKALENNEVDVILQQHGKIPSLSSATASIVWNIDNRAVYLVLNPYNTALADPALRQAFACLVWTPSRSASAPLDGLVFKENSFWRNPDAATPCSDLTDANISDLRWGKIVQILKSAGYSWQREPTQDTAAAGLVMPNGQPFPAIKLFSPSNESNSMQAAEAKYIGAAASKLGVPLSVEYISPQDIRYDVFSSKKYDMAILGWSLSLYPGYLCQWFGGQGQFNYGSDKLKSECEALAVESNLDAAQKHIFEIQSILVKNLPFIPLYAGITYDAFHNIHYPFETVLGGYGDLYGAPSYAIPAQ
jgi:peptide/nickel transport system substrate-binding protein